MHSPAETSVPQIDKTSDMKSSACTHRTKQASGGINCTLWHRLTFWEISLLAFLTDEKTDTTQRLCDRLSVA